MVRIKNKFIVTQEEIRGFGLVGEKAYRVPVGMDRKNLKVIVHLLNSGKEVIASDDS